MAGVVLWFLSGDAMKVNDLYPFSPSSSSSYYRYYYSAIFKMLRGKECQPRMLYPAKVSFRSKSKLKTFSDKAKMSQNLLLGDLTYKKFKEELRLKANDTMW